MPTCTTGGQKVVRRQEDLPPLLAVLPHSFFQTAVAQEVQTPARRISYHIWGESPIEGGKAALTMKDLADDANGTTESRGRRSVDCAEVSP